MAVLTAGLALVADGDASPGLPLRLGLGMLAYQFSIGIANDVVDAKDDRVAKPWKPLASGRVSRRAAVLAAACCAGVGLLVTATLPTGAWLIGVGGLLCGLLYDVHFKRTAWSWLPYSIAFPLVPVWVYVAADAWDDFLWWVFPLGALLGLSLHAANQAPDSSSDGDAGSGGITARMGERKSRAAAIALFGFAASAAALVLLTRDAGTAAIAAADGAVVAMLAPRAPIFFGRDGLFGLLAVGTGILAVVFLSAV